MIRATDADLPEIGTFLRAHIASSMFPLSNYLTYGTNGGHPYAVRFWIRRDAGKITDVLVQTDGGVLLPQCPTMPWRAAAQVLAGRSITGISGPVEQARSLQKYLGLTGIPAQLDDDELLFELDLNALEMPTITGKIIPFSAAPRDLITAWLHAYLRDTVMIPEAQCAAGAAARFETYCAAAQSHVVLVVDGRPVAMTGFNATLPEIVQIGGVYTPPDLRGRGYARQAVALHLAQAKAAGATHATLFATDAAAITAYRAIGFQHVGAFTICVFQTPKEMAHG